MLLFRCTKKMRTELKLKDVDLAVDPPALDPLGAWYANLFRHDRLKCVLFTNEVTLYSFVITGVTKPGFDNLGALFREQLTQNLLEEGIRQAHIAGLLTNYLQVFFAKTANRRVLGSMNDLLYQWRVISESRGRRRHKGPLGLNREINRTPMSLLKYDSPGKRMRSALSVGDL